jgi:hypothetical protein
MNLTALLGKQIATAIEITLIGEPEVTNIMTSDDEPYYLAKLLKPITVRCSVDPNIEAFETDEVYIRESAINEEGWTPRDEKDPSKGYFMPNWVVDFSKGQQLAVYQSETIKKWAKGNRSVRNAENTTKINEGIRAKIAARLKKS